MRVLPHFLRRGLISCEGNSLCKVVRIVTTSYEKYTKKMRQCWLNRQIGNFFNILLVSVLTWIPPWLSSWSDSARVSPRWTKLFSKCQFYVRSRWSFFHISRKFRYMVHNTCCKRYFCIHSYMVEYEKSEMLTLATLIQNGFIQHCCPILSCLWTFLLIKV